MAQMRRNDPCPCGSGRKYKKCCMHKHRGNFLAKGIEGKELRVYIALIIIFIASIILRYYGFLKPHGLTFDEGLYAELLAEQLKENPFDYSAQEAYRIHTARGERLPEYLDRPLFKHPPLYCYLLAVNYKVFGSSHLAAVSVSILLGSLMVLLVFFLGKALYDSRVGLLAAFFLCIDPVHLVCSEKIWMETTLSFFMLLAIFLFVLGQKEKNCLPLSGISVGLAMLTKNPGILSLSIIILFVSLVERRLFKEKGFWILCFLAFLTFLPWIIWNRAVYGDIWGALISVHGVISDVRYSFTNLLGHKGALILVFFGAGLFFTARRNISSFFAGGPADQAEVKRQAIAGAAGFLLFVSALIVVPFLREMAQEAFVWKKNVLVGWSNPFSGAPWHFYLTRLNELSPLYLFAFLSVFFILGQHKGDKLLLMSSFLILAAFIFLRNYQSRYILPAVPFLLILSARCQIWIFDRVLSRRYLQILSGGVSLYFILKTLRDRKSTRLNSSH